MILVKTTRFNANSVEFQPCTVHCSMTCTDNSQHPAHYRMLGIVIYCHVWQDKYSLYKLPQNVQFIPVNSRIFPLIPMESFQLWIFPEFCNPSREYSSNWGQSPGRPRKSVGRRTEKKLEDIWFLSEYLSEVSPWCGIQRSEHTHTHTDSTLHRHSSWFIGHTVFFQVCWGLVIRLCVEVL